jgi:hypothetical protein
VAAGARYEAFRHLLFSDGHGSGTQHVPFFSFVDIVFPFWNAMDHRAVGDASITRVFVLRSSIRSTSSPPSKGGSAQVDDSPRFEASFEEVHRMVFFEGWKWSSSKEFGMKIEPSKL